MKRELVAPTDVNTISVERGGVAVVSGVSIAATAGPLGTVIDLGDAYVSVQSGGFAEVRDRKNYLGVVPVDCNVRVS